MDVTVGWCSAFDPSWVATRLFWASRPPALCFYHLGQYLATVAVPTTGRAILDEDLGVGGLSPAADAAIAGSDLVYLSSHGRLDGNTYRFRLRTGEWTPTHAPPAGGPAVLVLDTCDLVTPAVTPKNTTWRQAGQWSPAIVLGFSGPASDGFDASKRGRMFAEHLATGLTYAKAWFRAIRDTQPPQQRDKGIAIGFGPTVIDARHTLRTASLTNPPTRTVADECAWQRR